MHDLPYEGAERAQRCAHGSVTSRLELTYAITPPNQTTSPERRKAIAEKQSARIATLPIDALLVYDLQDETSRNSAVRPFSFIPKVDALTFAFEDLRVGSLPRVVYRAVADQQAETLNAWLGRLNAHAGRAVFVGAPSRQSGTALTLPQAYSLCRTRVPALAYGGVLIAERHQKRGDEDLRMWAKVQQGCSFFISQTVWSVAATNALLQDLRIRAELADAPLPTILLTLSPCGSEQTLLFQEWLGVNVPAHIKQDLAGAKDMLERSVELAVEAFDEVQAFAAEQGIKVGCNVESVSTRAAEVDAAVELTGRIASCQRRAAVAAKAIRNRDTEPVAHAFSLAD